MTTLYVVTRLDMEENEFATFHVAHKTFSASLTAIIEDMNSLVDEHADVEKVTHENLDIHKVGPGEWATSDFLTFGWTITEVTVEG